MMPASPPQRSRRGLGFAARVLLGLALLPALARAELTVGVAVSLREPVTRIARQHEAAEGVRVRLVFAASSALAAQLRAGAPLDLLLSADAEISQALFESDLAQRPVAFASNRLVVVVARGISLDIAAVSDLGNPALRRIAVPHRAVPVGRYARAWLHEQGWLERLRPRLVPTEHARATLAAVDQGHVQAAIVYATDAPLARRARRAFEVPPGEHPTVRYAASVVRRGDERSTEAFLARLLSPEGWAAFAEAGFLRLPSAP